MLIKVVCLGITVCLLSLILSEYKKAFVIPLQLFFAVAVIMIVLSDAVDSIRSVTDAFENVGSYTKLFSCLIKGALICLSTKLACDFCRESGNIFVSDIIELAGRIMLLVLALPFVESIIKTAVSFAK
ncbi:MAG: SpoIIIAC/SpoIIIAD family protein [Oscillospiraceae bacterium]|nr:SpoIIIAC/SpoIIIAD family protein [Oscillospiraceae bacterium]